MLQRFAMISVCVYGMYISDPSKIPPSSLFLWARFSVAWYSKISTSRIKTSFQRIHHVRVSSCFCPPISSEFIELLTSVKTYIISYPFAWFRYSTAASPHRGRVKGDLTRDDMRSWPQNLRTSMCFFSNCWVFMGNLAILRSTDGQVLYLDTPPK